MRLAWLTDIHLNCLSDAAAMAFVETLSGHGAQAILISGDIGQANSVVGYLDMFEPLDLPVYFVLGNHDFYGGSIKGVRDAITQLTGNSSNLVWLNSAGHISLTDKTALVGHDSWADGRLGGFYESNVDLNDFWLIADLLTEDRDLRLEGMQALAREAAEHFEKVLPEALRDHEEVVVVTHVPPFRESCWHDGKISDDNWTPFFSSRVVGEVFRSVMAKHSDRRMTVLCGHTHSEGECEIPPNIRVLTGGADYGNPVVQRVIEVE